jgi:hypothetical protein
MRIHLNARAFGIEVFSKEHAGPTALRFAYRIDGRLDRLWLELILADGTADITLGEEGVAGGILADGRWHFVSVDMATYLRETAHAFPTVDGVTMDRIFGLNLHGVGRPGTVLDIAHIGLGRRYESSVPVTILPAPDATGIAGASVVIDADPSTVPPQEVTHKAPPFPADRTTTWHTSVDRAPGTRYVHVRILDGAGNWSDAAHMAVRCLGVVPPEPDEPATPELDSSRTIEVLIE